MSARTPLLPAGSPLGTPAGGLSRVPYLPGLDGLRAIAVVAVMIFHANHDWLPGGYLGVEVFFVISGYLITLLLLSEHERSGRVSLQQFWLRRARRLLPALFVMMVMVGFYITAFYPETREQTRGDFLGGLFYVSNWYQIWVGQGYGAGELFVPLRHLWSLAVEEQFYILWPLLMVAVLRTAGRRLPAVGLRFFGVALAITGLMAMLYHGGIVSSTDNVFVGYWQVGSRQISTNEFLYLGTITRAGGLFLGAGFAMLWRPAAIVRGPLRDKGRRLDLLAAAALALLLVMMMVLYMYDAAEADQYNPWLFRGGFLLVGLLTLTLIAAVTHQHASAGRLFGPPPLVWVGTRSYGLYLYHWPIFQIIRKQANVLLNPLEFVLAMVVTVVITEASYKYVETPIRTGHFTQMLAGLRRTGAQKLAALSVAAVVGLAACSLMVADPHCVGAQNCAQARNDAANSSSTTVPATQPSTVPGDTAAVPTTSTTLPKVPQKYVAVGESVMVGARDLLNSAGVFVNADENRGSEGVKNAVKNTRIAGDIGTGTAMIIQVGTNGPLNIAAIEAILAEIPADAGEVYFMTVHLQSSYSVANNELIRALPTTHPRVKGVIDWDTAAGSVELCADGIHISCGDAATPYANLILQAFGLPAVA